MEILLPQMGLVVWVLILLLTVVLPLAAIISLLRSSFKDNTSKLIWLLVILFVPIVGSIFYFLIGSKQRVKLA
jgi:hypothetical protein